MRPTIFTFMHMVVILFGGSICGEAGFKSFGLLGGVIGGLMGGASGHLVGCLMNLAMNQLTERYYRRKPTAALRAYLDEPGMAATYISCLIIRILVERGESVESFRSYVFEQLHSDDVCQRRAGIENLARCYPVLAEKLKGFNTVTPTTDDWVRLKEINSTSNS